MSTPAYVKKLLGQTGTGKKLYRDRIMDDGFVGHFDFVSDYVRNKAAAGGVAVPAGQTFKNLVDGAASATVSAAFAGGLTAKGLALSDNTPTLRLPDAFVLPSNETHFAVTIAFCNDSSVVYAANAGISLVGYTYQLGGENQWCFNLAADANGALGPMRFTVDGNTLLFPSTAPLLDGKTHFYTGEWEIISNGTQKRYTIYLDGVQVLQTVVAYDGGLNQVANSGSVSQGPVVGRIGGFNSNIRGWLGRIWLKRFAQVDTSQPIATIVAAEYAAYATRYGA